MSRSCKTSPFLRDLSFSQRRSRRFLRYDSASSSNITDVSKDPVVFILSANQEQSVNDSE